MGLDLYNFDSNIERFRGSPKDAGSVELIVMRPKENEREVLAQAFLDNDVGLLGDEWLTRNEGSAQQITIMNTQVAALITTKDRWPLAGDQLYVDLDISERNLPAGSLLAAGSAVLEVTAEPRRGCRKFGERFGLSALRLVSSPLGGKLRLRGINTRVLHAGFVRQGDLIRPLR
jgi:MOSC domain-containing protein YiiM